MILNPKAQIAKTRQQELTAKLDYYIRISVFPNPIKEYQFLPDRKFRFDYAWPAQRIALEIEGGIWVGGRHINPQGFSKDIEKYNLAAINNWMLLRVTSDMLKDGKDVCDLLQAAFEMTLPPLPAKNRNEGTK